jgi:hypothetical protein
MTEKNKGGRPRKHTEYKRTNLVMTPRTEEMLDVVMEATGTTSRSECIRLLIYGKYELLKKLEVDTVSSP